VRLLPTKRTRVLSVTVGEAHAETDTSKRRPADQ